MQRSVIKRSRVIFLLLALLLILLTYWFIGSDVEPLSSSATAGIVMTRRRQHESWGNDKPAAHVDEQVLKGVELQPMKEQVIEDQHLSNSKPQTAKSDVKQSFMTSLQAIQAKRRATIQGACGGKYKPLSELNAEQQRTLFKHLIVDDTHKIIYCYVPKAACANWKKVIQVMQGRYPSFKSIRKTNHTALDFINKYKPDQIAYRLQHYFKFTFVRHPLSRLVSAFRNKLHEEKLVDMQRRYGIPIIKKYRKNFDPNTKGDDVKFEEFVHYLVDVPTVQMNEHWRPFVELCQPCHVSYDFLGVFENLTYEANAVLEHVHTKVRWPERQGFYNPTTADDITKLYKEVPASLVHQLLAKYKMDFDFFQYDPSQYVSY